MRIVITAGQQPGSSRVASLPRKEPVVGAGLNHHIDRMAIFGLLMMLCEVPRTIATTGLPVLVERAVAQRY
jgi:hypothetical protein